MKLQVRCGSSYVEEVEADDFTEAVKKAFSRRLPHFIGEIMSVRASNPKKKSGWDGARYRWTPAILKDIGMDGIYIPRRKGKRVSFWLKTESPLLQKIDAESAPEPR